MTELFIHPSFGLALLPALGIAGVAWSARWVTRSGAIAAAVTGFLVFWLGGGEAAVPLIAFFVSSSVLSAIGKNRKFSNKSKLLDARIDGQVDGQTAGRSGAQVLANGGAAVALVIAHRALAYHVPIEENRIIQVLFLAAIATVNADTWATEIGSRWGGSPRQLSTWRAAAPGTSGAISIVGTLAAAAGALFIPLCTYKLWELTSAELVAVAWAGLLGSLFDSILGASIQGQFRNPNTNEISDASKSGDKRNALIRGLPWIDNNIVNFAASVGGALFCWALLHYGLRNVL
jgi:uncharacterized protein (TIGR00297 family)